MGSSYPNSAFTIFKEVCDVIAGETVSPREHIHLSLMLSQEAVVRGSNPKTAIAVPEQRPWHDLLQGTRKQIKLDLPVNQLPDSARCRDQNRAIVTFGQTWNLLYSVGHPIGCRQIRLPSPQPCIRSRPKIAAAVFMQREHSQAKAAILSMATDPTTVNLAQSPSGCCPRAGPYCSFTILNESSDTLSLQIVVRGQPAVLPTCKTSKGAYPECPIAGSKQAHNIAA